MLAIRVTYVGELGGSSTARPSSGCGSGTRCGRPARRSAWSPAATRRSTRSVWRRGIACGVPTSRPRTRPSRRGSGLRSAWRRRLRGTRRARWRRPTQPADCAARPRRRPLDRARVNPVRVDGASVGRVTSGLWIHRRSIDRVCLSPRAGDVGTRVEVEIFGDWIPGVVTAEPLFDPVGERIRA